MPEVLNRATKERQVKAALKKCRRDQQRELLRLLGDPPDFGSIPDEFWEQAEECERSSILPFLVPIFILQSKRARRELGLEIDEAAIAAEADKLMRRRADSFAKKAVAHTRKRVRRKLDTKKKREIFTPDDIESVFGDSRIEGAASTEVTEASTKADERAAKGTGLKEGVDYVRVWRLNPACEHCIFCPRVSGTDFDFWGRFCSGPPSHPRCCCWLDLVLKGKEQARKDGDIAPRYPVVGVVRDAARQVGITC